MALFDICGVRFADTDTACRLFYFGSHHELREAGKNGFPAIKIKSRYFYPVDLCRRYFITKDKDGIKKSVENLKRFVYRAAEELPKDNWFRKVDDYDDTRPWNA